MIVSFFNKNKLSVFLIALPIILIFLDFNYFSNLFEPLFTIDDSSLVEIPQLRSTFDWEFIKTIFKPGHHVDYYPIRDLTYWIDINILKADFSSALVFKCTNIFLYALILISLSVLIFQITNNFQISALFTLLWGLNPFHNETIFWIAARKDLVFLAFTIISTNLFFLDYKNGEKYKYFNLAIVSLVFAHLSKAGAVVCGVLYSFLFLYQYRLLQRKVYLYKFLVLFFISLFFAYINIFNYSNLNSMYFDYSVEYRIGAILATIGKVFLGFFIYIFNVIDVENWNNWLQLNKAFIYISFLAILITFVLIIFLIRRNKKNYFLIGLFLASLITIPGINKLHRSFYSTRYYELPILILFLILIYNFKNNLLGKSRVKKILVFGCLYFFICLKLDGSFWKDNISIVSKGLILSPENISLKRIYLSEYLNLAGWGKQTPTQTDFFNKYVLDITTYCSLLSSPGEELNVNGNLCMNLWIAAPFYMNIFDKYKLNNPNFNKYNEKKYQSIAVGYYDKLTGLGVEKIEFNFVDANSILAMDLKDLEKFAMRYSNSISLTTERSRYIKLFSYCKLNRINFNVLFHDFNEKKLISKQGYYKLFNSLNLESSQIVKECFKGKTFQVY